MAFLKRCMKKESFFVVFVCIQRTFLECTVLRTGATGSMCSFYHWYGVVVFFFPNAQGPAGPAGVPGPHGAPGLSVSQCMQFDNDSSTISADTCKLLFHDCKPANQIKLEQLGELASYFWLNYYGGSILGHSARLVTSNLTVSMC